MKKNSKTVVSVDVSNVRTRNTWGSVKPYTRVEMPKTAYKRQGKGRTPRGERYYRYWQTGFVPACHFCSQNERTVV